MRLGFPKSKEVVQLHPVALNALVAKAGKARGCNPRITSVQLRASALIHVDVDGSVLLDRRRRWTLADFLKVLAQLFDLDIDRYALEGGCR
jgi:hypothetical protein